MKLVKQAIETPDGTILESRHRHDYATHVDTVTGETYMVDGGIDYRRGIINQIAAKERSVYLEDGIEAVREAIEWGTRGKFGDEPVRLIKLKDMTNDHIEACLETQPRMHPHYREAFEMELEYRKEHGIVIEDI